MYFVILNVTPNHLQMIFHIGKFGKMNGRLWILRSSKTNGIDKSSFGYERTTKKKLGGIRVSVVIKRLAVRRAAG